jgi:hypothetical protein
VSGERAARAALVVAALIALTAVPARASDADAREPYACASRTDLVGPCFAVRGRLSFWNGAPSARIWPVGSTRLLGVRHDVLPPALRGHIEGVGTEMWAHFTVCPFTALRPGRMQFVCIEAWRDLVIRHGTS